MRQSSVIITHKLIMTRILISRLNHGLLGVQSGACKAKIGTGFLTLPVSADHDLYIHIGKTAVNIAFIIFNRPDTTEAVFNAIRRAKPDRLFVISDAPRKDDARYIDSCAAVRKIVDVVDWDCQVHRNYADEHMGLQKRIPSGLSWVFEQVSECIILEDDCLPHPGFFRYCSELLDRYRDDERVMAISGENFAAAQGLKRGKHSYYFSKYFHCWGWASWARAWCHFDQSLSTWPIFKHSGALECWCPDPTERRFWTELFDREYQTELRSWDYMYFYACWTQSGLTILPNVNLISNIGFDPRATYSKDAYSWQGNLPTHDIGELSHPPFVVRNEPADRYEFEYSRKTPLVKRMKQNLARLFRLHSAL
jgi:hypothetical protein